MTDAGASGSLKNLVLFVIALALLGAILALAGSAVVAVLHGTGFPPANGCWGFSC